MSDDKNLAFLRELVGRADPDGVFELHPSELNFVFSMDGWLWLTQADPCTHRFRLSDSGRAVLR